MALKTNDQEKAPCYRLDTPAIALRITPNLQLLRPPSSTWPLHLFVFVAASARSEMPREIFKNWLARYSHPEGGLRTLSITLLRTHFWLVCALPIN